MLTINAVETIRTNITNICIRSKNLTPTENALRISAVLREFNISAEKDKKLKDKQKQSPLNNTGRFIISETATATIAAELFISPILPSKVE